MNYYESMGANLLHAINAGRTTLSLGVFTACPNLWNSGYLYGPKFCKTT